MYSPLISPLKRLPFFIPLSPHFKHPSFFTIKSKLSPSNINPSPLTRNHSVHRFSLSKSPSSYIKTKSLILNYNKQPLKDEQLCKDFIEKSNIHNILLLYKRKKLLKRPPLNEVKNSTQQTRIKAYTDKKVFVKEHIGLPKYEDSSTQTIKQNVNETNFEKKKNFFQNDYLKGKIKEKSFNEENENVVDTITAFFQRKESAKEINRKVNRERKKSGRKQMKLVPLVFKSEILKK